MRWSGVSYRNWTYSVWVQMRNSEMFMPTSFANRLFRLVYIIPHTTLRCCCLQHSGGSHCRQNDVAVALCIVLGITVSNSGRQTESGKRCLALERQGAVWPSWPFDRCRGSAARRPLRLSWRRRNGGDTAKDFALPRFRLRDSCTGCLDAGRSTPRGGSTV